MASQELEEKLKILKTVFSFDDIQTIKADKQYIQKYYRTNKIPYSFFHTNLGFIHMGISRDGVYKEEDLLEHARFVNKYIKKASAENVLELATGRGGNSCFLSQENPGIAFHGLDLSSEQLGFAHKKTRVHKNYFPEQGDYHDLSRYKEIPFDIVFVIEALCHSVEKEKVLSEVHKILKREGYFIIIDGYRNKEILDISENIACQLIEKGMAVEIFETYDSFKKTIGQSKFEIVYEEDVSEYIIPTMERFARLAKMFLRGGFIAKILSKILPRSFIFNVLSGYLMPTAMRDKIFTYRVTVLKKT